MLSLAYLVKRHSVNVVNRVRFPGTTERMLNKECRKQQAWFDVHHSPVPGSIFKWLIVKGSRMPHYECGDESSNLSPASKMRLGVMTTCWSHKPGDTSSNLVAATTGVVDESYFGMYGPMVRVHFSSMTE